MVLQQLGGCRIGGDTASQNDIGFHDLAALAIAWLLEVAEVTAVVVGPNTVAQLAPVTEAVGLRLAADEVSRIEAIAA